MHYHKLTLLALTSLTMALSPSVSQAGIGKFIIKGITGLAKTGRKAAQETAESGIKRLGQKSVKKTGQVVTTQTGKTVSSAGSKLTTAGTRAISRTGITASRKALSSLGDDGVKAMKSLSPAGQKKLAGIADELAKNPQREEWLALIKSKGDSVLDFLWQRKGSVAVATIATVAVMKPGEAIAATEQLLSKTVEETTSHIAAPIAEQAAKHFPWPAFWGLLSIASIAATWWWIKLRPAQ